MRRTICMLLLLGLLGICLGSYPKTVDERMDKVVRRFENFKDIVNLNLFLYELHNIVSEINPSYGVVHYHHDDVPSHHQHHGGND